MEHPVSEGGRLGGREDGNLAQLKREICSRPIAAGRFTNMSNESREERETGFGTYNKSTKRKRSREGEETLKGLHGLLRYVRVRRRGKRFLVKTEE